MLRLLKTSSSSSKTTTSSLLLSASVNNSVQKRNYALPKNPNPSETNYMIEAIKDYVRPTDKPRIPKTSLQFKKDEWVANNWSKLKKRYTEQANNETRRRLKLKKAALEALPKELRVEAEKIDWNIIPLQLGVHPFKDLPPQPGYKPPEESINIEV
ncbi:hypothetical protein ABK040_015036 [Willaertia magna]